MPPLNLLYDIKMVLTFNFKEGEKTITFDELKKEMKSEKTGSDMELPGEPGRQSILPLPESPVDRPSKSCCVSPLQAHFSPLRMNLIGL